MHPKLEDFVKRLETRIEKGKEAEATLYALDGLEIPNSTAYLDWWGDTLFSVTIKHVDEIAPVLRILCAKFGKPVSKSVIAAQASFYYYFKNGEVRFTVYFTLSGESSCKLVEKRRYKEEVDRIEYEMVCADSEIEPVSDETLSEINLESETADATA